jgi:hypothetical protein
MVALVVVTSAKSSGEIRLVAVLGRAEPGAPRGQPELPPADGPDRSGMIALTAVRIPP